MMTIQSLVKSKKVRCALAIMAVVGCTGAVFAAESQPAPAPAAANQQYADCYAYCHNHGNDYGCGGYHHNNQ